MGYRAPPQAKNLVQGKKQFTSTTPLVLLVACGHRTQSYCHTQLAKAAADNDARCAQALKTPTRAPSPRPNKFLSAQKLFAEVNIRFGKALPPAASPCPAANMGL